MSVASGVVMERASFMLYAPIVSIENISEDKNANHNESFDPRAEDDVEIIGGDDVDPFLLYLSDGTSTFTTTFPSR